MPFKFTRGPKPRTFDRGGTFRYIFDPEAVLKHQNDKGISALFKSGGYGRQAMRNLFRVSKKKPSEPGNPPRVRGSNSPLKRLVAFAVDTSSKSLLVGPIIHRQVQPPQSTGPQTVPELLEHGGVRIGRSGQERGRNKRLLKAGRGDVAGKKYNYKPRPYIGKARDVTAVRLRELMKG